MLTSVNQRRIAPGFGDWRTTTVPRLFPAIFPSLHQVWYSLNACLTSGSVFPISFGVVQWGP